MQPSIGDGRQQQDATKWPWSPMPAAIAVVEQVPAPQRITEEEARAIAAAEGLVLVPAPSSSTGYKGVTRSGSEGKPFKAQARQDGVKKNLGSYATAAEASLAYVRHVAHRLSHPYPKAPRANHSGFTCSHPNQPLYGFTSSTPAPHLHYTDASHVRAAMPLHDPPSLTRLRPSHACTIPPNLPPAPSWDPEHTRSRDAGGCKNVKVVHGLPTPPGIYRHSTTNQTIRTSHINVTRPC